MLANDVLHTIGNTPHIRINRLFGTTHNVYIKSERSNPGGSIKDRIALAMVEAAEAAGAFKPGATIVEPTSGNTGVGLAMVAAVKGYRCILVMPDSMSVERRRLMLAYGATFELTPRKRRQRRDRPRCRDRRRDTGCRTTRPISTSTSAPPEIAADFPSGVAALITGVGTGGHITGCAQVLKKMWPKLKVYAVEPAASPVISGGQPNPHRIQGIGAGFVPKNLRVDLLDGVIQVEAEAAREMARRSAREELLVGVSSGATLAAIAQKLPEIAAGSTVLGFNYDTGERYLSIEGFLPHDAAQEILIVEDEPGIADTIQYALRTDGFEPLWCATGEEALARARAVPALVILDVGLPDASGFEIFKRLRETRRPVRLPDRAQRRDRSCRRPRARRRRLHRQAVLAARAGRAIDPAPQRQGRRRCEAGRCSRGREPDCRRRGPDAGPLLRPRPRALALRVRPPEDARVATRPRVHARGAALASGATTATAWTGPSTPTSRRCAPR